ncbi:C-C chemokine receptor type 6a [Hypanus sabinus]|uniref:C-C chemokine receptor type 6a n=1 Tax=Hypanus sabinus TaxID=79690 RepID=UPI0028C48746|nr:C-C chemokine receptor type 6a [Hypanus sabinus]XP_059841367.1 C-C chemokine receptor type 6a [Hypanus sabinus]
MNYTEGYDYEEYEYYLNTSEDYYEGVELLCRMSENKILPWFIPIFYSFIAAMGIIGNGLVVVIYLFYKRVRSMTDVLLMNLAIADILFVVTLPFWAVDAPEGWIFMDVGCKILKGIYSINFYSGMLFLGAISIDRYIAIVHATKSFNYKGKTLVYSKIVCIFVWLYGIIVSLPTFIFSESYEFKTTRKMVCEIKYPKHNSHIGKAATPALQLTLGFFVPLFIMIYCYSLIIKTLLQARNFQRHKAFRVVIAVVAAFVVCQVPYNVVIIYNLFRTSSCETFQVKTIVHAVTQSIAFLHCCLNPVLYAFIGVKFRMYLMKIMQDICCLSKKNISLRYRHTTETCVSRRTSDFDIDNLSSFTM